MPKGFPLRKCRGCETEVENRRELSATGLCPSCSERIMREEITQLIEKRGPHFHHWRLQVARSVGFGLLDEPRVTD
jgi:hypothetical protein